MTDGIGSHADSDWLLNLYCPIDNANYATAVGGGRIAKIHPHETQTGKGVNPDSGIAHCRGHEFYPRSPVLLRRKI